MSKSKNMGIVLTEMKLILKQTQQGISHEVSKPPRCASCKVFGPIHEECPKNTGAGEKKTVKKPSQTSRGVTVGPKIGVEPTIEVSNSNPFEVFNLVDNDVEFGTNGETTNLVNNGATSSGSYFMNIDNSSIGTTPIIDKIEKFEELVTSGQAILVAKAGNPLKKVEFSGEYHSEDEVDHQQHLFQTLDVRALLNLELSALAPLLKPPRCASCKVFGRIHEECPKTTGAGEKKTVKKPSQTSRGVTVGPKIGFKPQKEYRPVPKKPTASSIDNKMKGVEPTIEVSNSNPFEVFNLVDNDVEFGTNGETTNLVNNGATSSGSYFMNINNSSIGTTPIIDKIEKFEELVTSGQAILVAKAGNPLKKVKFSGEYHSEDEVASVDNDMARSMASEMVGFGTQSLLEQLRDSYGNGDYDDDTYDDDMYEGQDLSQDLQAICDNLDIRV
nr:hypothetical protein [Tanacetum cinerariifolium]